ncbi:MAG: universal stress protein [Chloroherpetonaceae bacterium]|nr:universal stress protein [Chloroherpetonaceae bacterium]MCS7210711.1 universal stress protein [Chloroherpetonaceae bacterium]MDW8020105.1 universal stress protein [Chloroherpetonaceae bacterium]MDW8466462.1 universal stress protein [Chloroherpetonaceae bacterium]
MIAIKKILCPIDFSEVSHNAILYGKEFACAMGAELILLHVVEPVTMTAETVPYVSEVELERNAKEELSMLVQKECPSTLTVRQLVKIGLAPDTIIRVAEEEDVDLLIMGSHGRSGLSRLLLGSVTEAVMRRAKLPILVVKQEEKEFVR